MANIKSAKKRVLVAERQAMENKMVKSKIATYIKKFKLAVDANEIDNAKSLLSETVSIIDSAVSKNIIKKGNADRKKSRLASYLDKKISK